MRAFKAFNSDMSCTLGSGKYKYAENKTYTEDRAQAHEAGFHCAKYILDCFRYYPETKETIVCPVEALGDIDEDGTDTKISCTEMKVGSRLTHEEIVFEAIKYLAKHPKFLDIKNVREEQGQSKGIFCIVRGKDPKAAGSKGTVLGLIKEKARSKQIEAIAIYTVDGKKIKKGRYYDISGKEVKVAQKS